MIKVKAIENFTLEKFDELKNIVRIDKDIPGGLIAGDIFECTGEMANYLTNKKPNPANRAVVEVIEIIPEEETQKAIGEAVKEEKPKTTRKPRTTKKK